ncbi:MAG: class I SAM-dependent methyltransferase [Rhodospirillaceae bacterium]|nr:class I SAM-dependent methyltransferase [Rhodospirillaceae bacterium]MBT3929805.1 class I SAM-dependent methyltransferase [Rhodospirillaceae bacterium]MBT4771693.1 class I SAM-dependent methyltransferase [Rhodospirillaceae bacterium]MBT5768062.1 class I SAM-dependent methyltransferase [Rhodospirillaceae bacterium]
MNTGSKDRDWAAYYAKTGDRPPRDTLVFALDRFDAAPGGTPRLAVDLGAGSGRDVIEMLRRGWRVLAIDAEPDAIDFLKARPDLPPEADLSGMVSRFEDADWPECDLVNSSFALPLCTPAEFERVWRRIETSLRPGGRFAGQLYGDRDSWAGREGITFHTRADIEALLAGFEIERLEEEEDDSVTPRGEAKHWHVFHIVARVRLSDV